MTTPDRDQPTEVDILLFEVGSIVYGVDASQVVRVDNARSEAWTVADLGRLNHGQRALVFKGDKGEEQLRVDGVRGVQTVEINNLRQLPKAAAVKPYALGIWLDGERPVLLIDIQEATRFSQSMKARP